MCIRDRTELHALKYKKVGLDDLGKGDGYGMRQIIGWSERYKNSKTDDIKEMNNLMSWLINNLPKQKKSSLIHNDYKYDNVVLDQDNISKIVGVLDWEMSTIGDPLFDLGTTLGYWVQSNDHPMLRKISLSSTTAEGNPSRMTLIDSYEKSEIEIVTWPKQGWREIDKGTGNEGGHTEGSFDTWWEGETLYGQNNAVEHKSDYEIDGKYILGYSNLPEKISTNANYKNPDHIYLWHANYHPDGGQLFFPTKSEAFISPLALPGDDIRVEDFKAFYFDGSQGLYIHPNIWHEGVFPTNQKTSFMGKPVSYTHLTLPTKA